MVGAVRCALLALVPIVMGSSAAPAQSGIADEVRSARLAQNAAIARRQLDSIARFWTRDVVIVTSRGQVIRGRADYRAAFAAESTMVYVRTPDRVEASVAWPLAWEEGTWEGRWGVDGPALLGGRYAAQWRRADGRWLIRSELYVGLRCSGEPCNWPVVSP